MRANIEYHEIALGALFGLFSLVSVGLLSQSTILGIDLLTPLYSFSAGSSTVTVTVAMVASLAILAGTAISNDWDASVRSGITFWAVVATVGLIIMPPFMPLVESLISSSFAGGVVAFVVQMMGFASVSYLQ